MWLGAAVVPCDAVLADDVADGRVTVGLGVVESCGHSGQRTRHGADQPVQRTVGEVPALPFHIIA